MPRRKHKKYTKLKTPFDSLRIAEENNLIKKYGLKNKREIGDLVNYLIFENSFTIFFLSS